MQSHTLTLTKVAERSLNDTKIRNQITVILDGVRTGQRTARGWKIEPSPSAGGRFHTVREDYRTNEKTYTVLVAVSVDNDRPASANETEFQNIVNAVTVKGTQPKWAVTHIDGEPYKTVALAEQKLADGDIGYVPLEVPQNWDASFGHLYGLEAHINRIKRSIDAAVLSNWNHRFHSALIGPPGCGKSAICAAIKSALGEYSVLEFDATSTTMAGAQKELAERDELPRVLLVEEIEKAPEGSLAWLLSILDLRGEIRKRTARGNLQRDVRMVAIATVNDLPTFKKVAFGALESRFANKVFFDRPNRALLSKILEREILSVQGDCRWIEPALDYADEIETSDPREVIAITMCGRDGLLDGSYQAEMRATSGTI